MDPQSALEELQTPKDLTILTLSEPFLTASTQASTASNKRTSNASSNDDRAGATPAILSADLTHYQELFSKLRFSYIEQVTKERFLRAITADQPEFVDASENTELEEKLKEDKAALKQKKQEVREMVKELEEQGRQLASRYENIQLQITQLSDLPSSITSLESTISQLQQNQGPRSSNPSLTLPLQPTLDLLNDRENQLNNINQQIQSLQAALPQKQAGVTALQDEVSIMNTRKNKAVEEAKEARRRWENGGMGDEIDERGRWLRSSEMALRGMLEV